MSNEFRDVMIPDMIKDMCASAMSQGNSGELARQRLEVVRDYINEAIETASKKRAFKKTFAKTVSWRAE